MTKKTTDIKNTQRTESDRMVRANTEGANQIHEASLFDEEDNHKPSLKMETENSSPGRGFMTEEGTVSVKQPLFTSDQDKMNHKNEVTKVKYIKDIGLITSTLSGTVKFYDAFDFKEVWVTSNKTRKQKYHTNITTMDICPPLGILATGGAHGRLMLIDPYAFGVLGCI
jgi:hypothetical protein